MTPYCHPTLRSSIPYRRRLPLLAAASALMTAALPALAQGQTIVITGNPLGRPVGAQPASVLAGPALQQRRAATLGETLDGLPGVAGSGFGPNASRPVIRGLDGDRIRLLDNGGAVVDASALSFDHATTLDPLVAERIEVLRGPAALLYGGNATGGVVNVIDGRLPRQRLDGLSGRAEWRLGGAARERSAAAVLEGGSGALAWHADGFARQTEDLRTPPFTPQADGEPLDPATRVRNSAARSEGGAVGASWVGDRGHVGVAVDTLRSRYGVTVEPDVQIRLARERVQLGGSWQPAHGWLRRVEAQGSHTRYVHREVEGDGRIGTTFRSRGDELRVQLGHRPLAGGMEGVVGLQAETLRFSALGEEAFVPGTQTRSQALFALQEWPLRAGSGHPMALTLGARLEHVRVTSDGDVDGAEPRFGVAQSRRFRPGSASVGLRSAGTGAWQWQASLGHTERAPAYQELYADGVHLATAAYERGDPSLGPERGRHLELGLAWQQGAQGWKAAVFATRFARNIGLNATGGVVEVPGEAGEPPAEVPLYRFEGVRARLQGAEIEGHARMWQSSARTLALALKGSFDIVRGDDLDAREPLPRLSPWRVRLGLAMQAVGWEAGVDLRHAARQARVPAVDTATPSSTPWDLWVRGTLQAGGDWQWFARLANAGDALAWRATAVASVRGLAPEGGRAFSAGVQARW